MGNSMIPTYTNSIRKQIIDEYLSYNLVSILIYDTSLGLTDTPNSLELEARRNLIMSSVAANEIGDVSLKGYKRCLITPDPATQLPGNILSETIITSSFQAEVGLELDQATHIVYVRGANQLGADPSNGNNRGDLQGDVILVEPIENAPIILAHPTVFEHTLDLRISTQPL